MGVPELTLAGRAGEPLQRGGVSILTNLGHPEWIANTPEEYLMLAGTLSRDLGKLAAIRESLRQEMQRSILMDAPRFARNVEAAFRKAWQHWCA